MSDGVVNSKSVMRRFAHQLGVTQGAMEYLAYKSIEFVVPGDPVGKQRARVSIRGQHVHAYTPAKTADYETLVGWQAKQAMIGHPLFDGPVSVRMHICVKIPDSWPKRKKELAENGSIFPMGKPDIDNVEKSILDGMNGIVFKDDGQVVCSEKVKVYSNVPSVTVFVGSFKGKQ